MKDLHFRKIKELELELLSNTIRKNPMRLNELIGEGFTEIGISGKIYHKKQ